MVEISPGSDATAASTKLRPSTGNSTETDPRMTR